MSGTDIKQILEEVLQNRKEFKHLLQLSESKILEKFDTLNNRIQQVEQENKELKKKLDILDKQSKKNNIILFGLDKPTSEITLDFICGNIGNLLNIPLQNSDIGNFYRLGSTERSPLKLEFVSEIKKLEALRNAKNLKGTKLYLSQDLTEEQRKENDMLRSHLREARKK